MQVYSTGVRGDIDMAGRTGLNTQGKLSVPAVIIIGVLVLILVPTIVRLVLGAIFTALHLAITVATLIVILLILLGVFRYLNKRS
jgi:hypothetical protein